MSEDKRNKEASEDKKNKDLNVFIANTLYPEAEPIFTAGYKSLQEIKDDCHVVVDTNALLVPYTINPKSLDRIKQTYRALARQKRLVIPGQVAREFAKNRASKIGELFQQLSNKRNDAKRVQTGNYPLLESFPEYAAALELEEKLNKLVQEYGVAIGKIQDRIRSWTWNDPVSVLYSQLFAGGVVLDIAVDEAAIKKELSVRQLHKIPPGYKDASKDDEGIGDFLIWKTILEVGKTHKKSLLFVSGEEKPDWWHRSSGQSLYPRYELVDEFRRCSEGQSFHILKFSSFLDLYGVSDEVVKEVRNQEAIVAAKESYGSTILRPSVGELHQAVAQWLINKFPHLSVTTVSEKPADLMATQSGGAATGVIIKYTSVGANVVDRLGKVASQIRQSAFNSSPLVNNWIVVFVARNKEVAFRLSNTFHTVLLQFSDIVIVVGYIRDNGTFQDIFMSSSSPF